MTRARVLTSIAFAVMVIAALTALLRLGQQPNADPATRLAEQLSCPACAGQSVADSNSAVAVSMRASIAEQLGAGKTPEQVRDWFVDRYGTEVLRTVPNAQRWLLWGVPIAVLLVAGGGAASTLRRSRAHPGSEPPRIGSRQRQLIFLSVGATVVVLIAGVAVASRTVGGDASPSVQPTADPVAQHLALGEDLEARGDFTGAADAFRRADALRPDPAVRLRLAFALLRSGQPRQAAEVARSVSATQPDNPDAVLVLGLSEQAAAEPGAGPTLRRFLSLAPDHPAAQEVRSLLTRQVASPGSGAGQP